MPNAYSYVRMSTEAQLEGDSYRRQTELSQNYAKKHGLTLIDDFTLNDIGISAYNGNNVNSGALGKFVAAVIAQKIPTGSYLLIESLDRLSRQKLNAAAHLFLSIINNGITIVTLSDEKIYSGDDFDFVQLIASHSIMIRAHEESEMKSRRVAAAWQQKRSLAHCKKLTKKCPAWLTLSQDKKRFIVDDAKAEIIKTIFEQASSGKGSHLITKQLNSKSIPPFGNSSFWVKSYVTKILKSRAVVGEYQPHIIAAGKRVPTGTPIPNYYPAIISEDEFVLASSSRRNRQVGGGGRRGPNQTNLFTHLLRCAYCNGSMRYTNKGSGPKGGQYLSCINGTNGCGCSPKALRYRDFETTMLTFMRELDLPSIVNKTKLQQLQTNIQMQISTRQEKSKLLAAQIDRTYNQITKQPSLENILLSKMADAKRELDDLELQVSQLKTSEFNKCTLASSAELKKYIDAFQSATPPADRFALSSQIKDIVNYIVVGAEGSRTPGNEMARKALPNCEQFTSLLRKQPPNASQLPYITVAFRSGSIQQLVLHPRDPKKIVRNWLISVAAAPPTKTK